MTYDVRTFLAELLAPTMADGPGDLDGYWRQWYEERAGIMEYVGNLPRKRAEAMALAETARAMRKK